MKYSLLAPSNINTIIHLPASKSISNRTLIINALAAQKAPIQNLSNCDDTQVMIKALLQNEPTIDILAAGTAMRFLTAYLSIQKGTYTITGTKRMQERPIQILVDALRQLGAQIEYTKKEGFPPLQITGHPLQGGEIMIKGSISSQYISALLLIAPYLEKGLTLLIEGELISKPYVDLTLNIMQDFGASVQWESVNRLRVYPKPYEETSYTIENDWSAASYWYALVALTPEAKVILPNLYENSFQGDSRGKEIFKKLGVNTEHLEDSITLTKKRIEVQSLHVDFIEIPDLAQTFVVVCCLLQIPFNFTGLQSLKIKETDRIEALIVEMKKLGYPLISKNNDTLIWDGKRIPAHASPQIKTYEDHRMAMAFAPASIHHPHLIIENPEVVTKSYPNFWADLTRAGFRISEQE
ncbi:MAG: 3-phosphoshikimate 1-carboxyvinyltransferase [Bacteroidales bacterium]|nr:3-phosphoshikimate 1-carboxyvinyltransferase [Bacteroidales bacterium]